MYCLVSILAGWLTVTSIVSASASPQPFEQLKTKRQSAYNNAVQVDLGYEVYEGVANATTGLTLWKGWVSDT